MAKIPRSHFPDGIYHVTTRGVDKCTVFVDDADRLSFLGLLASVVADYGWEMHTMCLMTNHYHLVVATKWPLLSLGMQRLNGLYAQAFNRKFKRWGHLWGDRFGSRVVDDDAYLAPSAPTSSTTRCAPVCATTEPTGCGARAGTPSTDADA